MSNFGQILSGLIIEKGISSQKLAESLNMSISSINDWKANRKDILLSNLVALCNYFNCSLDYLAGRSENDTRTNKTTLENFGQCVRKVMKSKEISSYVLRKETRFNSKYFNVWDKGTEPKLSTLIELANYFKCTLDELVGFC